MKKPKRKPKTKSRPKNIVAIQPQHPPGTFASMDAAQEAGRKLMTDLEKVFKKHNIGASLGGCLVPVVRWGEVVNPDGSKRKAWMINGVLAVKMTSKAMDPDAATIQGLLNGAATRIYGPPSAPPDIREAGK